MSMTYDPSKRDSSWTMIQPGCYIDPAGRRHIFPDEIVAELQRQHPEAGFNFGRDDYDLIVDTYINELRKLFPACRCAVHSSPAGGCMTMIAKEFVAHIRHRFATGPMSPREALLVSRLVLNDLADSVYLLRLADGQRLLDATDFCASLRELVAVIELEEMPFRVARDHTCPTCQHEHEGKTECSKYLGEGKFCRCEEKVMA